MITSEKKNTSQKLTIEQIDSAEIGAKIKTIDDGLTATRTSAEVWSVTLASGVNMTVSHSRILPAVHRKTLSGQEINHVDHIGYISA